MWLMAAILDTAEYRTFLPSQKALLNGSILESENPENIKNLVLNRKYIGSEMYDFQLSSIYKRT